LASFQASAPTLTEAEAIATTGHELRRAAARVHEEMKRGISPLASIANTAPLVGALGTVFGMFVAFRGYAGAKQTILGYIAEALAEALMLTVWGLLLVVVTMWCHRYLSSQLEAIDREMPNESAKLLNYLVIRVQLAARS
jgi:biopolymer transport protein ExbB/TolQ